jgi:hypothetical protein
LNVFFEDELAFGAGDAQHLASHHAMRGDRESGHRGVVVAMRVAGRPPVAAVVIADDAPAGDALAGRSADRRDDLGGEVDDRLFRLGERGAALALSLIVLNAGCIFVGGIVFRFHDSITSV